VISRAEILELAREFQLALDIVEKDYALGWLLAGIANHPELRDSWVFKGGTCLKKCFFETYRFSEDLDFTVRDPAFRRRFVTSITPTPTSRRAASRSSVMRSRRYSRKRSGHLPRNAVLVRSPHSVSSLTQRTARNSSLKLRYAVTAMKDERRVGPSRTLRLLVFL
jgi:hypothetical protein